MGKIKLTKSTTYRKSKTKKDKNERRCYSSCERYM